MSNYTKTTNFATKDALASGNPAKIVKGTEIDTEFNNIAVASGTKANKASPVFTGTATLPVTNASSLSIGGDGVTVTGIKDEDDMASNSATKLASQQSIKAYVDSQVTAQDLDVTDGTNTIAIDLDSEALSLLGGTGVTSTASGNGVTMAIDGTVATLSGSQTLTNKTLATPAVTGALTTNSTIDGRDVAVDGGKLDTVETNADVTDVTNVTAAGALMDSELTSIASVKALDQGVATTDSPTFAAATVTGEITANGGIALGDNDKATFGAGDDLQIYHDGSHSQIKDAGTGNLYIKATSGVLIQDNDTGTNRITTSAAGPVYVYHAGDQKLATTSTGIAVTGDASFADGGKATFGDAGDLEIFHNGSHSYIRDTGTGNLRVTAQNFNIRNAADNASIFTGVDGGAVISFYNGDQKLATTITGIDVTGDVNTSGLLKVGTNDTEYANNYIRFKPTGAAYIDHGVVGQNINFRLSNASSLDKTPLTISPTGIDVTGTVVADVFEGSINSFNAESSSAMTAKNNFYVDIDSDNTATNRSFSITHDGATKTLLDVQESGNVSFYEDTGTTAKMVWDASAEMLTTSGLTVGLGNAEIQGTVPNLFLSETDYTGNNTRIMGQTKQFRIDTVDDNNSNNVQRFTIDHPTGDISFYEDTGTTAKFVWDASAESLGIGESSPDQKLHVSQAINNGFATVKIENSFGSTTAIGTGSSLQFSGWDAGVTANIKSIRAGSSYSPSALTFETFGGAGTTGSNTLAERMRIDGFGFVGIGTSSPAELVHAADTSTGGAVGFRAENSEGHVNLLTNGGGLQIETSASGNVATIDSSGNSIFGSTVTDRTTADGTTIASVGFVDVSRTSAIAGRFTRRSTDGAIVDFRKDGTTVGNIGASNTDLYIGSTDHGIKFHDTSNAIMPWIPSSNGADSSGTLDLGTSLYKFKDLYLSGGVYLGGTGAANKLDDYEEGTWTPTIEGDTSGSAPLTVTSATYTKIGNTVHAYCYLSQIDLVNDNIVGNMIIDGLPFNVDNNNLQLVAISYQSLSTTVLNQCGRVTSGFIRLMQDSGLDNLTRGDCVSLTGKTIMVGATYSTTA